MFNLSIKRINSSVGAVTGKPAPSAKRASRLPEASGGKDPKLDTETQTTAQHTEHGGRGAELRISIMLKIAHYIIAFLSPPTFKGAQEGNWKTSLR